MANEKKCAHPGCTCMAAAGKEFCSDACRNNTSGSAVSCKCGHADCDNAVATSTSGSPTF